MKIKADAVITGGGLAGLGLAFEIKSQSPDIDIIVIEKRRFPIPRAVAKVGESTVEIGSRYLAKNLDMAQHLSHNQLKKFGIRMFFGDPADDFCQQDELGASKVFGLSTYQIDRGDLENHLAEKVRKLGVKIIDNADCSIAELSPGSNTLAVSSNDEHYNIQSRWLLDASGRRGLVKEKNNLSLKNEHKGNAVWFRIDKRIEIDNWSDSHTWRDRCSPAGRRWLSTNHLVGPGYWVWIIPLASGVTSIGIVMDDTAFEQANIDSSESAMRWLHDNQSRCAEAIEGANFLDFVAIRDYSYGCKQMFSEEGWAVTGEAGVFADPLYSPGSDFIAINNGFIVDLVRSEHRGEDIRFKRALFEKIYLSIYDNTLSLYTDQYGGFGDRSMMGLKLLWDYSYYWGVLSLLFFDQTLTNIPLMRQLNPLLEQAKTLNQGIQAAFRSRATQRTVLPNRGVFMDQYNIPCLQHFNEILKTTDAQSTSMHLQNNVNILKRLSNYIAEMLVRDPSKQSSNDEIELLGEYRKLVLA